MVRHGRLRAGLGFPPENTCKQSVKFPKKSAVHGKENKMQRHSARIRAAGAGPMDCGAGKAASVGLLFPCSIAFDSLRRAGSGFRNGFPASGSPAIGARNASIPVGGPAICRGNAATASGSAAIRNGGAASGIPSAANENGNAASAIGGASIPIGGASIANGGPASAAGSAANAAGRYANSNRGAYDAQKRTPFAKIGQIVSKRPVFSAIRGTSPRCGGKNRAALENPCRPFTNKNN